MNLGEFRTAVRTRLGVPAGDSFYTDTVLTDLVNAALRLVSVEADWRWLEKQASITLTGGTASYAVPSDFRRTIVITDSTGVPLRRVPFDELNYLTTAQSSSIRFFCAFGGNVHVRPVPSGSGTLTHFYIGAEPALVAAGDTPLIPAEWHDVVVEGALYLARMRAGNFAEAEVNKQIYDNLVGVMKAGGNAYSESLGGGE